MMHFVFSFLLLLFLRVMHFDHQPFLWSPFRSIFGGGAMSRESEIIMWVRQFINQFNTSVLVEVSN